VGAPQRPLSIKVVGTTKPASSCSAEAGDHRAHRLASRNSGYDDKARPADLFDSSIGCLPRTPSEHIGQYPHRKYPLTAKRASPVKLTAAASNQLRMVSLTGTLSTFTTCERHRVAAGPPVIT
jgi:hypothetical protein